MVHIIAGVVLAPFLLIQAWWVRKQVPFLAEPPGPRAGTLGNGSALRLLIIGDSAAAGVGTPHQSEALAGQLTRILAETYRVDWLLEAKTGATTDSVLHSIENIPQQSFDLIITSLGVNDITGLVSLKRWLRQQYVLRNDLLKRFKPSRILVSGLPPMHGFPALPQPLRWILGARATAFDVALQKALAREEVAIFVSLRFADDPSMMASDGFHPGPEVYAEWATRLARAIKQT